jgi:Fe-S-cluster containining protein
MAAKKFLGKIPGDPWEALAKGPREVMASLWQTYLTEVLGVSPKSSRFKMLRQEMEKAADFPQIFQDWHNLSPEVRAEAWRRLIGAAQERIQAYREICIRCGECCELGSPTLLTQDLGLFQQEVLTFNEVYTLRPGEQVTHRDGKVSTLKEERLKVREVPGSRQCYFYLAATCGCRIYEHRPEQCRRQNCWGEPAPPPAAQELLNRAHLLAKVPEVWDLIRAHEERCACGQVVQALEDLGAGREEGGDALFEALHFDHYLRQMLQDEWGLTPAAAELLLGRPLPEFLRAHGLVATLTPEGVFRLERREGPE